VKVVVPVPSRKTFPVPVAMTEATLILATLAQRVRLRLRPGYEVRIQQRVTIRPTQLTLRFVAVEPLGQRRVLRLEQPQPRPLTQHDPPQRHAELARIPRHAEFLWRTGP